MRTALGIGTRFGAAAVLSILLVGHAQAGDNNTLNSASNTTNDMAAFRGFDPTVLTGPTDPHPDTSDPSGFLTGSTEYGYGLIDGASDQTVCMNRIDCDLLDNSGAFQGGAGDLGSLPDPAAQSGDPSYYYLSFLTDGDDGSGGTLFEQGLRNDALSYGVDGTTDCRTVSAISGQVRCNELDVGFHQSVAMIGPGSASGGHGDGDQVFDMFFSIDALVDANGDLLGDAKGTYTQDYTDVTNGVTTVKSCTGAFTYSTSSGYTQTAGAPYECP